MIPHHNHVVRILNISPIPQTINKHTPILTLADVPVLEGQDIPVSKNTIALVEFNLQHMGVSEKEVFQQFLHIYEDIFAKTGKLLEATKLVKHRIDIGDSAPVYKPPYRLPFQQQPVVRQHIEEMLWDDIIRPSASPSSAPVVLVGNKKWTGPYRITHLGGLNARIEEIHGGKEQLVHLNRLERCLAIEDPRDQLSNVATGVRTHNPEPPRREKVQTISGAGPQVARRDKKAGGWGINRSVPAPTGEANRSEKNHTTGQPEIPPAEEPTSSGHPREAIATTEPPEDSKGPITRTQGTTGTPESATTGAEAVARMEETTLPNL
ncbi:hypothetical protein JTB14_035503 [Gonioctena quinquepunctata]|nr:hypothetical protein JTB14_035503 [Gonioctena quinquepunctata]